MSHVSYERCLELTGELTRLLKSCEDTGSFSGHDQQFVRQMGLLLFVTAKPKTGQVVRGIKPFLGQMDEDWHALLRRLCDQGGDLKP